MSVMSTLHLLAVLLLFSSQIDGKTVGQQQVAAIIAKLTPTKKYDYIVKFLNDTDVVTELKLADGNYKTLFIPTDKAIDSLPKSVVATLKSSPAMLTAVVKYHIFPGYYPSKKLLSDLHTAKSNAFSLVSVNGKKFSVKYGPKNTIKVGAAIVTAPDLLANGITAVHGINAVL